MDSKKLTRRVTISVVSQIVSQIFVGVLVIIALKIMTNDLGTKTYGVYATALAFVTTFSLLSSLGIQTATVREIAKQPDDASEIISHNMGLRLLLCMIMVPLISGLGFLIYPHASTELRVSILVIACYLFFDAIFGASLIYFAARVRNDVAAAITGLQQMILLALTVGVVVLGFGLLGYTAAYVIASAAAAIIAFWAARKHVQIRPKANLVAWRRILNSSIVLGTIMVVNGLYFKADSIMISIFKGTTAVGIYNVAYLLISIFQYVPGYLMNSLLPTLATSKDKKHLQEVVQNAFYVTAILGFLLPVIGFAVQKDLVLVVSSRAFIAASTPFAILMGATLFSYMTRVFSTTSVAINKHHGLTITSVSTLILNVLINLVAIPRYGIVGAAWATAITETFAFVIVYLLFRRRTGVSINLFVAIKPATAAALAFLVYLAWHKIGLSYGALINTVTNSSVVSGSYFLALYTIGGIPEEAKQFVNKGAKLLLSSVKLKS